jgi:hypothetical protein
MLLNANIKVWSRTRTSCPRKTTGSSDEMFNEYRKKKEGKRIKNENIESEHKHF